MVNVLKFRTPKFWQNGICKQCTFRWLHRSESTRFAIPLSILRNNGKNLEYIVRNFKTFTVYKANYFATSGCIYLTRLLQDSHQYMFIYQCISVSIEW